MDNKDRKLEADLKQVFKRELRNSLKSQMKDLEEDKDIQGTKNNIFSLKTIAAIAASILLLVSVYWLSTKPSAEDLFATNFELYENYARPTTRKNLQQALELFQKIEIKDQLPEDKFYLALVNLALYDADTCIELLKSVDHPEYKKIADWYLALAWLQKGDSKNAKSLLRKINQNPNHPYFEKAREMLKQEL